VRPSHLSLTARMSLMFMSVVIAVLVAAGLGFNMLSQHHFKMLDQQALGEKLESTRYILGNADGANLAAELPQLQALLGAHQDLAATILSGDGTVLFTESAAVKIPDIARRTESGMWDWQDGEHTYQGVTAKIQVPGQPLPLTAILALDVTSHAHFLDTLQRWFWIGLTLSALVSAALGWVQRWAGQWHAVASLPCARSRRWPPRCPPVRCRSAFP
jgi:two-component system, OmpR family, heavy metal sensor histidine kinase CusS